MTEAPSPPGEGAAPLCPGPDPKTRAPRHPTPAGACDTHAHVFGPAARYPYPPERSYTPPDCPLDDYLAMRDVLGLTRAVIVQASIQGTDNAATLDAIKRGGDGFRGVAVVAPDIGEAELRGLHDGGMRGARMTTLVRGGVGPEHVEALAGRIGDLGWLIEVHLTEASELIDLAPRFRALPVPCLIDHFGRVRGAEGPDHPGFEALLGLLRETDNCWVKLASWYRLSDSGPPGHADMRPLAEALIEARPDRLVWGSNWPHPAHDGDMPNDGDLLDQLADWVPDDTIRRRILVDNPARLFGFDATPAAGRAIP